MGSFKGFFQEVRFRVVLHRVLGPHATTCSHDIALSQVVQVSSIFLRTKRTAKNIGRRSV